MHSIKVFEGIGERVQQNVENWFDMLEENGQEITIISTTQSGDVGVTLVIIFKYNDTKGE